MLSNKDLKDFASVCAYEPYYSGAFILGSAFVNNMSLKIDATLPAPAAIDASSRLIMFNPKLIFSLCVDIFGRLEHMDYYKANVYYEGRIHTSNSYKLSFIFNKIVKFLILHEAFHYCFTLSSDKFSQLVNQYCSELPESLVYFTYNVVEDSSIERLGVDIFYSKTLVDLVSFGIRLAQAGSSDSYIDSCIKSNWSIRSKLYYFILRAYDLTNKDVQSMYNNNPNIGWSQETLDAFDTCISITDSTYRARYVCETLVHLIYKDLLVQPEDNSNGQNGPVDLLSAQNLVDPSDKQEPSQDNNSSEEKDNESSNKDDSDNTSNSSNLDDASNKESKNSESDSKQDSKNANDTDKSGSVSPSSSNKSIDKDIDSACKELLQEMFDSKNSHNNSDKSFCNSTESVNSKLSLEGFGVSRFNPCDVSPYYDHHLSDQGIKLYNEFSACLQRLYNFTNGTCSNLEDGDEIDEDLLPSFFLEKNLAIYKSVIIRVKGKSYKIVFVADRSGSMSWCADTCIDILASLDQAFEDSNIKTCIYLFGSTSVLVKDFEDTFELDPSYTSRYVNGLKQLYDENGGTNPTDAVLELAHRADIYSDDELDTIVFYLTDGALNSDSVAPFKEAASILTNKGVHLFGIGINFDEYSLDHLHALLGEKSVVRSYDSDNLISMAEDIYSTIIDEFIKA